MLDYIADIVTRFTPTSGYGVPASKDIKNILAMYLNEPNVFCICDKGKGAIMGAVLPYMFNPESKYAYDIGFFVEPEYRGTRVALNLLLRFESKAKEMGADRVVMVGLALHRFKQMERFYAKLGYRNLETHFIKEI